MNDRVLRLALLADAAHVNVQRWCEGLSRAGAEVHVLTFSRGETPAGRTYCLPIPRLPGKLQYLAAVPRVRRQLKLIRPHVVAAYYVTGYGTLGALTGFCPLVQVTSGSDVLLAPRQPVMRRLLRYSLSRASLVTAWAPHMAEAARRLGAAPERLLVLPRGIPVEQFAGARCRPPQRGELLKIICTRSFKPDYNLDQLLRAMRLLQEEGIAFQLTLAGDGPQRAALVGLAQRLGLGERVLFPGFIANDQLPGLLAGHNLYLSVIGSDGVSASLLEAMAVGLLPVVPDHPANRFWIEPWENGLLFDEASPAAIARGVKQAFADFPLRQRAWQENFELVRADADLYRNAEIFVEHFRQLAGAYRGRSQTVRAELPLAIRGGEQ